MQSNNQQKNDHIDNPFNPSQEEVEGGQRSFAEIENANEDEDQIENIFNQGNLYLRNEESEFVQEDVGSLQDENFKSQSNSDVESNNDNKSLVHHAQVTPHRPIVLQQGTRYGDLVMCSPDMHPRHTTFMPVFTQEDEVDDVAIVEQHIGHGRHLSRDSGVSEEDFYVSSQFSQPTRLFPHDISINHYGFPNLSQQSQQDIHHLNFQQQQSPYMHKNQFANEQFYFKAQDRAISFTQSKLQKQDKEEAAAECSLKKIKLPSDDGECMEVDDTQQRYPDEPELSSNLLQNKSSVDQSPIEKKNSQSKSFREHSINNNESSETVELKEEKLKQIIKPVLELAQSKKVQQSDSKSPFQIVKGKRRNARERKYFEKRRKLIEQVMPSIKEIGAIEWDTFMKKLEQSANPLEIDKLNPYSFFNTSTFWHYISSQYFAKSQQPHLQERLCLLVNQIRGGEGSKIWDKVLRDHPTFIRKSHRVYVQTLQSIDRKFTKEHQPSSKKNKDKKRKESHQDKYPTEVEDLISQLQADREDCTTDLEHMVCKLLDTIKSSKRPKLFDIPELSQIRQQIQKNLSCQQIVSFNQELNHYSQAALDYITLEDERYSKIKAHKLKQLRDQYERARQEGNKDYIVTEPIGKSFMGMLQHSYETCFICSGEDYEEANPRLQCSVCEFFVHQECLGESLISMQTEFDVNNSIEPVWTCQSCQIDVAIKQKFTTIDISFKPSCVFCGLTGGIMRSTTSVCADIKKTPGCNNTSWSVQSANGATISHLTRKEKDYQIKLTEAKIKLLQADNDGQFPMKSEFEAKDNDSLPQLPDLSPYAPSFIHWAHLSCASWLLQKNFQKKKPIILKNVPSTHQSKEGDKCEICGGSNGIFQTCTFTQKKPGEDKVLEELQKECASHIQVDIHKDSVNNELLDEMIEGGLCDIISSTLQKNNRGFLVEVCKNKMHVECARRAEYYMKFDPEIETLDFFCSQHTPLPLKIELKQSLNEQITNITEFVENYQTTIKENTMLSDWTEDERTQLISQVVAMFFEMPKMCISLDYDEEVFEFAEEFTIDGIGLLPGNKTWKVTLDFKQFPWSSIKVGFHDSIDCWKKYWEIVGLSEERFKSQIMGQNKANLQKYAKFVKLRQQKIAYDLKDKQRVKVKDVPLVGPDEVKAKVEESIVESEEVMQLQKIEEVEVQKAQKVVHSIEQPKEEVFFLQEIMEEMKAEEESNLDKQVDAFQTSTQKPKAESRSMKRLEKMKEKKDQLNDDQLSKIPSCYCRCPLLSIFQLKNFKRKQRHEKAKLGNAEDVSESSNMIWPSFKDKIQEESYKQQLSTPGNRCTKSGITRCSNKTKCVLGAYFHVECCYNHDTNFDMKKKARDKWFCLECRKSQTVFEETDSVEPLEIEEEQLVQEVVPVSQDFPEVAEWPIVKEEEPIFLPEKRASKRLQSIKKPEISAEIVRSPSKRIKVVDEALIKVPNLVSEFFPPQQVEPESVQEVLPYIRIEPLSKRLKRADKQQSKEHMLGGEVIADLLKKVESTFSPQMSQKQLLQLKKAIEKHTNFLQDKKEVKPKQTPVEEVSMPQAEPSFCEIEIKIDAVKQQTPKFPKRNIEKTITPVVVEKPKHQVTIEPKIEPPKIEQIIEQTQKLSLSQQFLLNLKKLPAVQKETQAIEASLHLIEDSLQVPIQFQMKKIKKEKPVAKLKSKKSQEVLSKSTVKFDQNQDPIQNQPVTIAYFNHNQKEIKPNSGHLSDAQISQPSHSPPGGHQNPLEPKLAAGPASGYPQQAFSLNGTQNVAPQIFGQSTEIQPFVIDVPRVQDHPMLSQNEEQAEIQRKLEKRERKRKRKAERKRREMDSGLIQIDTKFDPSLISIETFNNAIEQPINLIQLETQPIQQVPKEKQKKKGSKKPKKPKEKTMDIVIDTDQKPVIAGIELEQSNKIMIPTQKLQFAAQKEVIIMPTFTPQMMPFEPSQYQPQFTDYMPYLPYQVPVQMPSSSDFLISIPLEPQQKAPSKAYGVVMIKDSQKHAVEQQEKKKTKKR